MKRWVAILLVVVTVCAQAVTTDNPPASSKQTRTNGCCGCRGMACCVAPNIPEPAPRPPTATTTTSTVQKSVPAAAAATVVWMLPEAAPASDSFSPPAFLPSTQSLHQRLCVLLI